MVGTQKEVHHVIDAVVLASVAAATRLISASPIPWIGFVSQMFFVGTKWDDLCPLQRLAAPG